MSSAQDRERGGPSPERTEVDRVARLLIAEWERVEHRPVNVSYLATFADMARVVIADRASIVRKLESELATLRASVVDALSSAGPEVAEDERTA